MREALTLFTEYGSGMGFINHQHCIVFFAKVLKVR